METACDVSGRSAENEGETGWGGEEMIGWRLHSHAAETLENRRRSGKNHVRREKIAFSGIM